MPPPENLRSMHWHSVCWRRISAALFKHRTDWLDSRSSLFPNALLWTPGMPQPATYDRCLFHWGEAMWSFISFSSLQLQLLRQDQVLEEEAGEGPLFLWIGSLSVAAYGSAAGQSITAPRQQETEIFECERLICWQNICVYNGPILDQWWLHWQLRHSLMFLTWQFKNKGLLLVTFPRFSFRSNCKVWEWLSHGHGGGIGAWESQATRPVSAPPSSSSRWLISSRTRNLRPDIAWEWPTAVP